MNAVSHGVSENARHALSPHHHTRSRAPHRQIDFEITGTFRYP